MEECLPGWGFAGRTSHAEIRAGAVLGVSTQVHNLAMGDPRAILLCLFGAVLCLTGIQTFESSGKRAVGWEIAGLSWV